MTEPNIEEPLPPPLDLGALTVEDVSPAEHVTPDASASRDRAWKRRRKSPTTERAPSRTKKAVPRRKGMFVAPLTQMYTGVGAMLMPFDLVCGTAIVNSAERCAETMDVLAYNNEAVRRALWAMIQTSTATAVIVAHAPILMAVAMHHVPAVRNSMQQMGADMMTRVQEQMSPNGLYVVPDEGTTPDE